MSQTAATARIAAATGQSEDDVERIIAQAMEVIVPEDNPSPSGPQFTQDEQWSDAELRSLWRILGRKAGDFAPLNVLDLSALRVAGFQVDKAEGGGAIIRPPRHLPRKRRKALEKAGAKALRKARQRAKRRRQAGPTPGA